jgi:hypothetical protein
LKKVTYQAFVKKPKKYMKDLPILLTMFGKPYAIVGSADAGESPHVVEEEPKGPKIPLSAYEESEYCQSCKEWKPKILMEIHSHVVHGL